MTAGTVIPVPSVGRLVAAVRWIAAGERGEVEATLDEVPDDELDPAIEVVAALLQNLRARRAARDAAAERGGPPQ